MLILNKFLPILALPLGFSLLLLFTGLLRKRRWPIACSAILLYVCSIDYVADHLERWRESKYIPVPIDQAESADAIVPLSGIFGPATPAGILPNIAESGERLEAGIQLWQHKKAPWLVFTGGRMPWRPAEELEGRRSAQVAISRGIPSENVVVTDEVGNTADEAATVARLAHVKGWRRILLVTSANHMSRAVRQFRNAGLDVIPFPVDYHVDPESPTTLVDFLPKGSSLERTENCVREWYGMAFYMLAQRFKSK